MVRLLWLLALLIVGCSKSDHSIAAVKPIDYPLENGQIAVVVPLEGISAQEGSKIAKQRAARITLDLGARYFVINSQESVQLVRPNGTQSFSNNLYQDMIIEEDFGKQEIKKQAALGTSTVPALRITFTPYWTQPPIKAIDATRP